VAITASETVKAIAVLKGYVTNAVASAAYVINVPTATPTFSPAGGTYTSAQIVGITSATPGATIYYTTNGSRANSESPVYSGPITVSTTLSVRAIAIAPGHKTSDEALASFTIDPPPAAPTFSPTGGAYNAAQLVTITTSTAKTRIYYTTDGSTPTINSREYSHPIMVATTETIKAIAAPDRPSLVSTVESLLAGQIPPSLTSDVASADYTVKTHASAGFSVSLAPPTLTLSAGQSGKTTVLVTPENGFASTVSFNCSGLPAGVSCSFAPATVTPSGTVASTTLTIGSSIASAALPHNSTSSFPGSALAMVFCCFGWKRRRALQVLLLVGVAAEAGLCTGCATNVVSAVSNTSNIAVIATNGSLQPSTNLTLTMQ
jgi:hypothetical protein